MFIRKALLSGWQPWLFRDFPAPAGPSAFSVRAFLALPSHRSHLHCLHSHKVVPVSPRSCNSGKTPGISRLVSNLTSNHDCNMTTAQTWAQDSIDPILPPPVRQWQTCHAPAKWLVRMEKARWWKGAPQFSETPKWPKWACLQRMGKHLNPVVYHHFSCPNFFSEKLWEVKPGVCPTAGWNPRFQAWQLLAILGSSNPQFHHRHRHPETWRVPW